MVRKKRKPVQDAGTAERPLFVTNPEVQQELQEASQLGSKRRKAARTGPSVSSPSRNHKDTAPDDIESMAGADLDVVETVGKAAGVTYQDDEELDLVAKIKKRDRKRWELNLSSSEDYTERSQRKR